MTWMKVICGKYALKEKIGTRGRVLTRFSPDVKVLSLITRLANFHETVTLKPLPFLLRVLIGSTTSSFFELERFWMEL